MNISNIGNKISYTPSGLIASKSYEVVGDFSSAAFLIVAGLIAKESNIIIKNQDKNIFITENKNNYLHLLAQKLKTEIVHHNNFIGGRYSVLSEVGMLPAELMGLNSTKFKQLNNLIKNKKFIDALVINVNNSLYFLKKKKFNSIILNYDESSESLFRWYQQLMAESLGKKGNGILPTISLMPKDNHSVMQLYLDGPKNNFFTFFHVSNKKSDKIINSKILDSHSHLKNKSLNEIIISQKLATEKVFLNKKIPFREIDKTDHQVSFYAATKKSTESLAHSYSSLWKLPITMLRFFTVKFS